MPGSEISIEQVVRDFLQKQLLQETEVRRLVVGFSGGLDSTVLLHVLARLAPSLRLSLLALHVHHGLSPHADAWAEHAERICRDLGLPFMARRVRVPAQASLEAAARSARQGAFAAMLEEGDALLLAQHRDDQAETVLFRLLRGSGVTGLGAMRAVGRLACGVPQWRPLLALSRRELEAYAREHDLAWIEDESNADQGLARNFLRWRILPLLRERWPAADATLAATAQRLQEADGLLREFAEALAVDAVDADGRLCVPAVVALAAQRNGEAKQRLLLRHWLQQQGFRPPDEDRLEQLRRDMLMARADAAPRVAWAGVEIRRYRDRLYAMAPLPALPAGWSAEWDGVRPLPLPDGRVLRLAAVSAPTVFSVRYRQGGERFRPAGQPHSRELRTLFQEHALPPWQRDRLPLVWRGQELVAVAGVEWGRGEVTALLEWPDA